MVCPHCQQEHPKDAEFCPNTGKTIEKKSSRKATKTIFGVALILLVCAAIGFGGYWLADRYGWIDRFSGANLSDPESEDRAETEVPESTPTQQMEPSPTPLVLHPSEIIVLINDEIISTTDFQRRVQFERSNLVQTYNLYTAYLSSTQDPNTQQQIAWLMQAIEEDLQTENTGQRVINQMIDEFFILEEAAKRGITVSEQEVQVFFDEYFNYDENSKTAFFDSMKEYNIDEEFFRNLINLQLIRDQLNEAIGDGIAVPEEEVVWARHILIQPDSQAEDEDAAKEEALATAQNLLSQILGGAAEFEDLAAEYNPDSTSASGGDLGWFGRGQMVAPFEEAAFAGEIGDVVGPVETQFGFHLIEILGKEFRTNQAEYDRDIASALTRLLNQYKEASKIKFAPNWQEMIPDQPNVISIFPDTPPSSSGDD